MTYGEALDAVNAFIKKEQKRQKEQASSTYSLATLIKLGVASLFDKEAKYPSINELYPGVFERETKEANKIQEEKQMIAWKQNMLDFAKRHNKKWGENS